MDWDYDRMVDIDVDGVEGNADYHSAVVVVVVGRVILQLLNVSCGPFSKDTLI